MSIEVVEQVKAELEARGVPLAGPCGAFAIASRVAWRLRATGLGLNHQDANRTHCAAYSGTWSPDFLLYQDGQAIDCLKDGGADNIPSWQAKTGDPARWRAPFDPDADVLTPVPLPPVVVPPAVACKAQPVDFAPLLAEIAALRADVQAIKWPDFPKPPKPPTYDGTVNLRGRVTLFPREE